MNTPARSKSAITIEVSAGHVEEFMRLVREFQMNGSPETKVIRKRDTTLEQGVESLTHLVEVARGRSGARFPRLGPTDFL